VRITVITSTSFLGTYAINQHMVIQEIPRNVLSQPAGHFVPISFRIDFVDRRRGNHPALWGGAGKPQAP